MGTANSSSSDESGDPRYGNYPGAKSGHRPDLHRVIHSGPRSRDRYQGPHSGTRAGLPPVAKPGARAGLPPGAQPGARLDQHPVNHPGKRVQYQHPHQHALGVYDTRPTEVQIDTVCIKHIMDDIEKAVNKWPNLIANFRKEDNLTSSQEEYLIYEIKQTEKEWKSVAKMIPNYEDNMPAKGGHKKSTDDPTKDNERIDGMQTTIKELSDELSRYAERIEELQKQNGFLKDQLHQQKEDNENLMLRLSKITSDKLLKSNPNIADLSDHNRPTKLGEVYSETYDNEYTEAFGVLCDTGYTERETVDILRDTLLNTYEFCSEKSSGFLTKTEDALRMLFLETDSSKEKEFAKFLAPERTEIEDYKFALKWKPKIRNDQSAPKSIESDQNKALTEKGMRVFEDQMKKLRKDIGVYMIPYVQKAYFKTRWDPDCIEELKPFIEKCVFITWMMNVQSPSMAFLDLPKEGERFDGGRYKAYTSLGDSIDYVVWPTLMLTKEGPVIGKGVAQGK